MIKIIMKEMKQKILSNPIAFNVPAIKMYNRLEGRPVSENFDRSFRAEIRDPLWMLSRQWQMDEFQGEDAGSPAQAKITWDVEKLEKYKGFQSPVEPFDFNTPLEAKVEKRPVYLSVSGQKKSYNIRMLIGRQWMKLLEENGMGSLVPAYITKYPVSPVSAAPNSDAEIKAHPEIERRLQVFANRLLDGGDLFDAVSADILAVHREMGTATIPQSDFDTKAADLEKLASEFIAWYGKLFYTPDAKDQGAWDAQRLEYRFDCSSVAADGEKVYSAQEYYHGKLEWYNFESNGDHAGLGDAGVNPPDYGKSFSKTFIPAMVQLPGAPDSRWWAFEDNKVNFSDMDLGVTDLNKLLFVEFGLIFANDWFILPIGVETGDLIEVSKLSVTDVFGDTYDVPPANETLGDWDKWTMFSLQKTGLQTTGKKVMILPSVYKVQESEAFEKILFVRDEMSNLVWAIEKTIEGADGRPKNGDEAAREMKEYFQQYFPVGEAAPNPLSDLRYRVMSHVNENWIPFLPVNPKTTDREVKLQRGAALRFQNNAYAPVRPRTTLISEGLEKGNPYFINEEEISGEGIVLSQSYQRTRWTNGKVFNWLGVKKKIGRGEGQSGLVFDRLKPVK